jgi:pyruvate-formate lyase-activating enzyme
MVMMHTIDYRYGNTLPYLLKRHFKGMINAITPRKAINGARFLYENITRPESSSAHPFYIKIEPTNICDHKCPGCASLGERKKGFMDISMYKEIIDFFKPWCLRNCLYGQGESFLHPSIFEMIKYSEERRCPVSISSNFNSVTGDRIKKLLDSGLDYLIICIDGATQETHSRNRKGGNLERVLNNLKELSSLRAKGGYRKPAIEVQTIAFEYIKDELSSISNIIKDCGADIHSIRQDFFNSSVRNYSKKSCPYLWGSVFFTWSGKCFPCEEFCNDDLDECLYWQDVKKGTDYWNNKFIREARKIVKSSGNIASSTPNMRCVKCMQYR